MGEDQNESLGLRFKQMQWKIKREDVQRQQYLFMQFTKQTIKRINSNKVYYSLGFCACFIVVLIVALMMTIIANTPVVFLRLGELSEGEVDIVTEAPEWAPLSKLNYTLAKTLLDDEEQYTYHAPRFEQLVSSFNIKSCDVPTGNPNWPYTGFEDDDPCQLDQNCVEKYCAGEQYRSELFLADAELEKRMGVGRDWTFGGLGEGEALVQRSLANTLGVGVGDTFYITINMKSLLGILWTSNMQFDANTTVTVPTHIAYIPVRVANTFGSPSGKFSSDVSGGILLEYKHFLSHASKHLHPFFTDTMKQNLASRNLYEYAQRIIINLPPPRIEAYLSSNFDVIQKNVVNFASRALFKMGFNQIESEMPVLESVSGTRFFGLFLGLILNIIIVILLFLSILLIYSLLMINVETRKFEMGALRMLGAHRSGIVELLLLQAFSYAIPSWAFGLVIAQLLSLGVMQGFQSLTGIDINPLLTSDAVGVATALGLVIPIIAAFFPIRSALSQNLQDSLDVRRSKTKAVKISIERSEGRRLSASSIIVGIALAGFGFGIYFLLPLSLLSFNFALLLNMFFFLLLGMLLGLVVLALNLEHLLEKFLVFIVFFWEHRAISQLVLKNLVAHRERNRKTWIMYALSLGFIIFINVAYYNTQDSFTYQLQQQRGVFLQVEAPDRSEIKMKDRLEEYAETDPSIESYTWVSIPLSDTIANAADQMVTNVGHVYTREVDVYGVSPNLYTTTLTEFLNVRSRIPNENRFTIAEALYTVEGSSTLVLGSSFKGGLGLDIGTHCLLKTDITISTSLSEVDVVRLKPLAFLDLSPAFFFSRFPSTEVAQSSLVSFSSYVRLSQGNVQGIEEIKMKYMLIKMKGGISDDDKDLLVSRLRNLIADQPELSVWDYRDAVDPINQAQAVMTYFFNFTTAVAMIICAFSLMSSMYTNIYEQTKEIGVLRAVGVPKVWMYRVYIYEAFVLVFSASLMGIIIGTLVGFTITLQRVLFTQLPVPFTFPYVLLITVFISSIFISTIASLGPIRKVLKAEIVQVMRILT